MVRNFCREDVQDLNGRFPRIFVNISDLVDDPPDWMKQGLQQTASGYGAKLNTGRKISYRGNL